MPYESEEGQHWDHAMPFSEAMKRYLDIAIAHRFNDFPPVSTTVGEAKSSFSKFKMDDFTLQLLKFQHLLPNSKIDTVLGYDQGINKPNSGANSFGLGSSETVWNPPSASPRGWHCTFGGLWRLWIPGQDWVTDMIRVKAMALSSSFGSWMKSEPTHHHVRLLVDSLWMDDGQCGVAKKTALQPTIITTTFSTAATPTATATNNSRTWCKGTFCEDFKAWILSIRDSLFHLQSCAELPLSTILTTNTVVCTSC